MIGLKTVVLMLLSGEEVILIGGYIERFYPESNIKGFITVQ